MAYFDKITNPQEKKVLEIILLNKKYESITNPDDLMDEENEENGNLNGNDESEDSNKKLNENNNNNNTSMN